MNNEKLYELSASQNVVKLQCKYSLFKRVINILSSVSTKEKLDFDLMKTAFNKVIERNDCLRLMFVKKKGRLMQYFRESAPLNDIPIMKFKSEKEFNDFYLEFRKKPIAYTKGKVVEPVFIKNFDGTSMVFLKVCHLALDAYGINIIYKDIFDVYNAMKEGKELPASPRKFEDLLKKDLPVQLDPSYKQKNKEFFLDFFKDKETPFYTGLHGKDCEIMEKRLAKNKCAMKMFFVHNDTEMAGFHLDEKIVADAMKFCEENKITLPSLLFLINSLTASRINGNRENMMPIEVCNCRGTVSEKNTAGTKVQSLGFYTTFDYSKSFKENMTAFLERQGLLYRHIGYPDTEFEMLMHKVFKYGMLDTLYPFLFSFIPFVKPKGAEIMFYPNGKFALPVYLACMYDVSSHEITVAYEYQTKLLNKELITRFFKNFESVLSQAIKNPEICIADIKVKE